MTILACATTLPTIAARVADAQQQMAYGDRGPRFLAFVDGGVKPLDVLRTAVLNQRLALDLDGVTIKAALEDIIARSGLRLVYRDALLPADTRVHLRAGEITVAAALAAVLLDAGVDVGFDRSGGAVLVKRPPPAQNGSVTGRVTDFKTGTAIVGATVVIERTSLSATTDNDGQYLFPDVPAGTYVVRARYIGYAPASASVTVTGDQEVKADLTLEKSPQRLDELVTTGTLVPTEVRALPSPITVITAADIEKQAAPRMTEIFRRAVPGAVVVDFSDTPQQTPLSVRGAASLAGGGASGTLKVYLDGVELSNRSFAAVDPNSIERIEVIRGPQAAAIYGSDAIGGVMQIFTKRGNPNLSRPEANGHAAFGVVQSPYETERHDALRQEYSASISGGRQGVTYQVGGGWARTGAWLPDYFLSTPSAYGAASLTQGPVTLDLSARFYAQNGTRAFSPVLQPSGFLPVLGPFRRRLGSVEETYGARIGYGPFSWWRHTLTMGMDRFSYDEHSTEPRRATPADTFLFVLVDNQRKASIGYNTSISFPLSPRLGLQVISGFDHYQRTGQGYSAPTATAVSGAITTAQATREVQTNTGYFAQAQINIYDKLFLTGGVRADRNSGFGGDLGTPVSPRAGISYVHELGRTSVKVRASYGKAINPPLPQQKNALTEPQRIVLANPLLKPEQQRGVDGGIDLVFGDRASLSLTGYSQIARDLIQYTLVDATTTPASYQFLNIGRVKNSGIEVEATFNLASSLDVGAHYAYTRSKVEELGPNYAGDLRIGDQVLVVPRHTASASLTIAPFNRARLAVSADYVGERTQTDFLALTSCFGGTAPCRASGRDYLTTYPAFTKLGLSVSYDLGRGTTGYIAADNLANGLYDQFGGLGEFVGRTTMVGVRATGW